MREAKLPQVNTVKVINYESFLFTNLNISKKNAILKRQITDFNR